ncbi:DUF1192 domain-containing protein [Telmatospirillum sp.]|uniref:DUF1192 domain-containing protein n=1 Tax=Telmatospirillum sp. TaxID=2079197 RepID=UPI00284506A9|nr:DUF1192 domain-containing protein [Telmatospirillum sp.]MDR3438005.1 DUF1192 domain-containing protein [Telmatospirillum sp.]
MDTDDLEPRRKTPERRNLEPLSIEELHTYIGELEAEIVRVKTTINTKKGIRNGAESLFRR